MSETFGQETRPVLACLDGGDDGDRALRYAVDEAQRRRTGVRLVHVPPDFLPHAPGMVGPRFSSSSLLEVGARILKEGLNRCHELAPGLYAEAAMPTGARVNAIVAESEDAAAVVLGTREWHTYRVFGGSTTVGVAARADCPVIAVPPSWHPDRVTGRVVVGVDEMAGPATVLTHAFDAARIRGAQLTIVHAWTPPHPYGPVFGSFGPEQWADHMESWLDELTTAVRAAYPDVETQRVAPYGIQRSSVPDLARDADLLVIGRVRHQGPLPHRLGGVAQHAIHAGISSVEIVAVGHETSP